MPAAAIGGAKFSGRPAQVRPPQDKENERSGAQRESPAVVGSLPAVKYGGFSPAPRTFLEAFSGAKLMSENHSRRWGQRRRHGR